MPSAIFAKLGINQTVAFGLHLAMYGMPTLLFVDRVVLVKFGEYFERYVFNDWPFLTSLTLLVLFDTISGGVAAWTNKKWDPEKEAMVPEFSGRILYKKLAQKTFGIALYVTSIGVIKNTIINGEENLIADLVDSGFYSVMIGFEGASILRNVYKIYPFEFIKWALEQLEIFYDKRRKKVKTENEE